MNSPTKKIPLITINLNVTVQELLLHACFL